MRRRFPTVAQDLIRSVLGDVERRHSRRDLEVATAIVKESTDAICDEIFFVPLRVGSRSGYS